MCWSSDLVPEATTSTSLTPDPNESAKKSSITPIIVGACWSDTIIFRLICEDFGSLSKIIDFDSVSAILGNNKR